MANGKVKRTPIQDGWTGFADADQDRAEGDATEKEKVMEDPLKELPRLSDAAMGPCVICRRQLLETELPIFFRVDAKQCGIDMKEVRRHVGLAQSIAPGADGLHLAAIMGPGVKPVVVMDAITPFNVCHSCAMDRGLVDVLGHQWEADRKDKGLSVPLQCEKCGCTEHRACMTEDGPCAWLSKDPPICTACAVPEEQCPGHVAGVDPKICGRCGTHVDSFRPPEEGHP